MLFGTAGEGGREGGSLMRVCANVMCRVGGGPVLP